MPFQKSLLLALLTASLALGRTVVNLDHGTGAILHERSVVPLLKDPSYRPLKTDDGMTQSKFRNSVPENEHPKKKKKRSPQNANLAKEEGNAISDQRKIRVYNGEKGHPNFRKMNHANPLLGPGHHHIYHLDSTSSGFEMAPIPHNGRKTPLVIRSENSPAPFPGTFAAAARDDELYLPDSARDTHGDHHHHRS
ncbi:hypothetical protein PGT21_001743 [Puccinia graminis f. sp. tritici]|uniref:Uncharacterized protein n=2 Tax=Puccinia graminis f. sp. tritici TaxID=56615 RepID=E3KJS6_PUCGT|nr:uncharacterized protein PGTG_10710 [Puccinia graminis f. sp. tritici CRL 75-36-700-3]EFP84551.1 hypothetical protein PGTG_10710 [Puccinia graminis f. sp. tritici CRL 75-36-700-3]KAA1100928.1 hypothetical protein PGT21_001743 [Puccinia graminis f. sp. tritici]